VGLSRREALCRAAGAGALVSLSSLGLGIPASAEAAELPRHPAWKFVFVNHVTTNPFWAPLRYGAEDACSLLGCSYQWTGSEKSIATEMVNALNAAVSTGRRRRHRCLPGGSHSSQRTGGKGLGCGIPVVSYNADTKGNKRLCYIGQDLFLSGKGLGQRQRIQELTE
jgi:simple sugar transport system substrate-binding protein